LETGNIIVCAQINNNQRTATGSINTVEIVDPDKIVAYLNSMLDNGFTLDDALNIETILEELGE
jgi:hypothetical protein